MALGLPPPPPESWERWPQHHPTSADYAMMATGLLPYDHRPVTTAPLQRPALAPHFVAGPPFHLTSMTPVASPGTYHGSVHYAGYIPYSPPPAADAPFKPQHCVERPQPSEMHLEPGFQRPSDGCLSAERSPSPSIKSEAQMSTSAGSTVSDATTATSTSSKGLVPNVRINGAPVHQFHTPVDKLMRAIQAMMVDENSTDKAGSTQADQEKQTKTKPRRFCCDIPGCSKIFAQKNNLETHRRAHTGERPYVSDGSPVFNKRVAKGGGIGLRVLRAWLYPGCQPQGEIAVHSARCRASSGLTHIRRTSAVTRESSPTFAPSAGRLSRKRETSSST